MKLTLLLIPLLFFSSCTVDWTDEKNYYTKLYQHCNSLGETEKGQCENSVKIMEGSGYKKAEKTSSGYTCPMEMQRNGFRDLGSIWWCEPTQNDTISIIPITEDLRRITKDLGSDFNLSQTDDETTLSYSGKTIKTWSHTPPETIPFVWDDACTIVWKGFEKLPPEDQSTGKQGVWDALTEKEKKECMKNKLQETIEIELILDGIFFEIRQLKYEGYQSWIVFSKNGNTQEVPIQFQNPKVSFSNSGINIFLTNNYDGNDIKLLYTNDFSQLLSKEEIPKR